jgi:cation:H+ antiporter
VTLDAVAFVVGAVVSLATSWLLVTRIERVGDRLGLSEAQLGIVAAMAADAPEVTAAVSAISQHQGSIGAGVVIGSNVFNLAALLGLSAIVSGFVALHRRVVLLGGVVAVWTGVVSVLCVALHLPAAAGLALALPVLAGYFVLLGLRLGQLRRLPLDERWCRWLSSAIHEEELELAVAIRPVKGRFLDAGVAFASLVVVVAASVAMERGATHLGRHFGVANAVTGGVVLAVVTSLPNAVAAVHLASKGRGAAALSTALNSNNVNVVAGLLIPASFVGLAVPSLVGTLTSLWFVGLTLLVLALAYQGRGLRRSRGWIIVACYLAFVAVLVVAS